LGTFSKFGSAEPAWLPSLRATTQKTATKRANRNFYHPPERLDGWEWLQRSVFNDYAGQEIWGLQKNNAN
jgi:hypothetical protein